MVLGFLIEAFYRISLSYRRLGLSFELKLSNFLIVLRRPGELLESFVNGPILRVASGRRRLSLSFDVVEEGADSL